MKQILICLLLLSSFIFSGCYTEKKAEQQTEKALDEYPLTVADIIRQKFPCVTTDSIVKEYADSTQYIKSRDSAITKAQKANKSIDSLKAITSLHSEELKNACKDYQDIINEQGTELMNLNGIIKDFKPVIKYREVIKKEKDMADVDIANKERDRAKKTADSLQQIANMQQEWIEANKAKHKGKFEILIPWWLIIALALLIGASLKFNLIGKVKGLFGK